jgi:hypothetical protein
LIRLLALAARANPATARRGVPAHVLSHVTALAAHPVLGVTSLVITVVVIASFVALARAAQLAVSLMAQLMQAATTMASGLFMLVIFVVVILALLGHL